MKKIIIVAGIIVLIVIGIVLVNKGKVTKEVVSNEKITSLDRIIKSGVIKVGTEGTYAPFTFHDENNVLTGFDIEIAEEVAKRLGVKAEFIETKWDGIFAGIDAKRFDMIANQVTIRADRVEKYDFSTPYIKTRAVLIVNAENTAINSFADLKDKKSGQSLTSNLAEIATANGAEIVQVDGFNQALDLLISNRIDATINDRLSFLDFKKQQPDASIKVVDQVDTSDEAGLLFNKGNDDLVDRVNVILADMMADGTYLNISTKWFGEDVSS